MMEQGKRVEELLARVVKTMEAYYRAAELLGRHQKLSLWTLAYLALGLVFIPLVQALGVPTGLSAAYLNAAEALLAVLTLVHALLVGLEKFVSQAGAAQRGAIKLDRLARRITARDPQKITDAEHTAFVREYFDIIEGHGHHQPGDQRRSRLLTLPRQHSQWPAYAWLWVRVQAGYACNFIHYIVALGFVAFIFVMLLSGMWEHAGQQPPPTRSSAMPNQSGIPLPPAPQK